MRRVNWIIIGAMVIICCCLAYLFVQGIGLRTAKLIKPSIYSDKMAEAIVSRLFPDFSEREKLIIGGFLEGEDFVPQLSLAYKNTFHKEPVLAKSYDELLSCKGVCWWVAEDFIVDHLSRAGAIDASQNINYLILTHFRSAPEPSTLCKKQQRLELHCLRELSIHEAARKIKTQDKYFFLNKYEDNKFFLFLGQL